MLWAKQKAWLSSSLSFGSGKTQTKVNRAEHLEKQGRLIRLPEIFECSHLINWVAEMGLYAHGMNGPVTLSHTEIDAWVRLSDIQIRPEEVAILRRISNTFCSFYHTCDNDTPEPMGDELTPEEVKQQQAAMRKARRMRVNNKSP
jgi:hypothetical protein